LGVVAGAFLIGPIRELPLDSGGFLWFVVTRAVPDQIEQLWPQFDEHAESDLAEFCAAGIAIEVPIPATIRRIDGHV
jgi:hypothetical protein